MATVVKPGMGFVTPTSTMTQIGRHGQASRMIVRNTPLARIASDLSNELYRHYRNNRKRHFSSSGFAELTNCGCVNISERSLRQKLPNQQSTSNTNPRK